MKLVLFLSVTAAGGPCSVGSLHKALLDSVDPAYLTREYVTGFT